LIYSLTRDVNYPHYILFVAGSGLLLLSLNGIAFEYFWPAYPAWGNTAVPFFLGVANAGLISFARSFLETKANVPKFDKVLLSMWVLCIAISVGTFVFSYSLMIKIATPFSLLAGILVFGSALICWSKNNASARYFLLAWSTPLLSYVVYPLKTFNILPANFWTNHSLYIGFAVGALLLPLALSSRVRLLQEENERIQLEANQRLEARVMERTQELNSTMAELRNVNETLTKLNLVDSLTGVKNRKYFDESLMREWRLARRDQNPIALLILDIDYFKKINDNHGHLVGDEVLKQVAVSLKKMMKRPADEVVRYGGEEFVIILSHTDKENALQFAEQIRQGIAALDIQIETLKIRLTISIGVAAVIPNAEAHQEKLLAAADDALYQAKNAGRNCVIYQAVSL
jgi:two-component system, sensor histidine kinase LadS